MLPEKADYMQSKDGFWVPAQSQESMLFNKVCFCLEPESTICAWEGADNNPGLHFLSVDWNEAGLPCFCDYMTGIELIYLFVGTREARENESMNLNVVN